VRSTDGEELGRLLEEQVAYYRALGADYLDQGLDLPGGDEVAEALDAFRPAGSVLELACGPGVWTGHLLRHATDVTAVDASPEMLAIAAARFGNERVRFVQADLFTWKPDRRYDVVFFGFWISHVPPNASPPSGRWWPTASSPRDGCSSPTTPTGPRTSCWRARRRQPSAGRSPTAPPTGS
jgi:SAM-dependent methyltransferase